VTDPSEQTATAPGAVALAEGPDLSEDEDSTDPDWAWVAEWRASGEKTPWAPGIALGAFMLVLVASAIFVLTAGVSDTPWLAVVLNVLVAGGIGPQLWLARHLPVLRFVAWGAALGVLAGWLACFVIPFPT
jgi:hypothetical protein